MAINKFYAPITVQGASTYANAANDEVLTKSAVAGIISTSVGNNTNLPTGAAVQTYVSGLCSTTGGSGKNGKIVKLDSNGLLDTTMLPSLAITDTFTAASKSAMLALSDAKKGDICIRTDENKTYILTADGYATESNWTALATPTDAVLSVNTKTGAVTLGASDVGAIASSALVTSVSSTSTDATVPSALSVYSFVNGGYAAKSHTHTSANISDSVSASSGITNTAAGLVQAKAVYAYAAPVSHTHTSANVTDAITAGTGITSTETKLVQAKAVYSYIDGLALGTTYAAKSHTHTSADISDKITASSGIVTGESKVATAGAVYDYVDGLALGTTYAAKSHTHASGDITGTISAATGITSSASGLVQGKAVEAYAAPKSHTHTSANISDSVSASTGITSSATGLTQAKAVYDYVAGIISGLDLGNTYAAKSHTHVAADLPTATSSAKGIASFGTGLTVSSGAVTLSAATADALGGVKVGAGNGLTYSSNKITMALASGTTAGACKQGTGTTVSSGAISVNFSTDISADATSDVKAATPKAVKTYVDSLTGATSLVGEITGNGTATKFAVAHTFGTDVLVQIVESTTGQIVGVPTTLASNSVTVEFATAPASGTKFKVYISKCVGGDSPVAATVVTA